MSTERSVELIEKRIAGLFSGKQPPELYQPMSYILGLNCKRRLSQLTLWGCHLYDEDIEKAITPAVGVEVFYGFFLIHDDLLEHRNTRQQKPSIHSKWDSNIAILSGDAMIFKALELLIQVETVSIKPAVKMFNQCFTDICEQKQRALNHQAHENVSCGQIISGFSMQLGALIAGADSQELQLVDSVGRQLGGMIDAFDVTTPAKVRESLDLLSCPSDRVTSFVNWYQHQMMDINR